MQCTDLNGKTKIGGCVVSVNRLAEAFFALAGHNRRRLPRLLLRTVRHNVKYILYIKDIN